MSTSKPPVEKGRKTPKTKTINASNSEPVCDPKMSTSEKDFVQALHDRGIKHAIEFREELIKIFRLDRPPKVKDLFAMYRRGSHQYDFLLSLRAQNIARPDGGGPWMRDSAIVLTREGVKPDETMQPEGASPCIYQLWS